MRSKTEIENLATGLEKLDIRSPLLKGVHLAMIDLLYWVLGRDSTRVNELIANLEINERMKDARNN